MALDAKQAAKELLDAVGGSSNIVSAAHCATRMRLVIADDSKVDKDKLENAVGAKGNFQASGQLQVIYGTGTVNKVYDEFIAQGNITAATKEEAKEAAAQNQNKFMAAIKVLSDVFVPIIPAIVASGMLMGSRTSSRMSTSPPTSTGRSPASSTPAPWPTCRYSLASPRQPFLAATPTWVPPLARCSSALTSSTPTAPPRPWPTAP